MKSILDKIVRAYLRWFPVTEGKHWVYRHCSNKNSGKAQSIKSFTKDGFWVQLNPLNEEHRRIHYYGEHDERYEIALLRKLIDPGNVFWDIGANIGFYTCLAAQLVGNTGRVIAFEPAPVTRQYLDSSIKLNNFSNVSLLPYAVGENTGTAMIHMSDPELGEGTASLKSSDSHAISFPVEIRRIDDLSSGLPTPDVVKIDVEGVFGQLWRGGQQFFSKHAPIIMAELKGEAFVSASGNLRLEINALGYAIFEIHKHSLKRIDDPATSKKRNFLLVKEDSAAYSRLKHMVS